MELYTLTSRFLPKEIITDFTSAIWTERYSAAGDVQIVVSPTPSMIKRFAKGTFIGLRGSSEIMMIETQSIENGLLTVTGWSVVKFFNNRTAWFADTTYDGSDTTKTLIQPTYSGTDSAGSFISNIISAMVINPVAFASYWTPINLDWGNEIIHGLALGRVDINGDSKALTFNKGPLYDGLAQFAEAEGLGFKLYLESASYSSGFVLRFATYRGRDKTSGQTTNRMIRLTPKMDTLTNVKEINSIEKYINVIYVSYKNQISIHYPPDVLTPPLDFNRRVLQVDAEDIFLEDDHILAYRETVARNAFIDHVYIQAVDGQILPPISDYKFKRDYDLGDIIELEGYTGTISKARVTEYIRSQDQFGIKEFPTLAVIDPQHTGYMPDVEPSFDDGSGWPWDDDPGWDFPIDDSTEDDPEHDPDARKDPNDNPDPNPDPTLSFPSSGNGGGDGGDSSKFPVGAFLAVGYYPDQSNGEKVCFIKFSDQTLQSVWSSYTSEDPDGETSWVDILPQAWTSDNKIIVLLTEFKSSTDAYPWTQGTAFWCIADNVDPVRLTDTISNAQKHDADGYFQWGRFTFWAESETDKHLYINRKLAEVPGKTEYLYADGTYSTDSTLHNYHIDFTTPGGILIRDHPFIDDPGPVLTSGTPIDIYHSTTGALSDLEKLLGTEDFSGRSRWATSDLKVSPNGSKLFIQRPSFGPTSGLWYVSGGIAPASSGTFRILLGTYGSYLGGIYTFPIPYNATAEDVWTAIMVAQEVELPTLILDDPRDHGFPYTPWSGGPLPLSQVQLRFHVIPEGGAWMDVDNHDLIDMTWLPVGITPESVWADEGGPVYRYLCDPDGSALTELDFGDVRLNTDVRWSTDSTKLYALASSSGHDLLRLFVYDVASEEISFPLDYSSEPLDSSGYGPLRDLPVYSPDGSKFVWVLSDDTSNKGLWVANSDGTGSTELFHQTADASSSNPDDVILPRTTKIVWNSAGTKLAIIDNRDQAPIWVISVDTGALTKVWPGSGWTNPDDEKWLYDPLIFTG